MQLGSEQVIFIVIAFQSKIDWGPTAAFLTVLWDVRLLKKVCNDGKSITVTDGH